MDMQVVVRGMPDTDYHAHPAFGNSDLTIIRARSPAHYQEKKRTPDKDTPAKLDGKALHCAILEPEQFLKRYCVEPKDAPRDLRHLRNAKTPGASTLESIAFWDAWDAEHAGMTSLTADSYDLKMRCAEAVRLHPELRGYFDAPGGESELSVFATDPETGLPVKCRPDYRVQLGGFRVVIDAKSTEDARNEMFAKSAASYGYFQQAPFYTDVCAWADELIDLFLFIAFEKEAPFGVKVYEPSERGMDIGRAQYREGLTIAKRCVDSNDWPLYSTGIEVLDPPAWMK